MGQTAMRHTERNDIGSVTVDSGRGKYAARGNGTFLVNDDHVKHMRSLGFEPCQADEPEAPEVASPAPSAAVSVATAAATSPAMPESKHDSKPLASSASPAASGQSPTKR